MQELRLGGRFVDDHSLCAPNTSVVEDEVRSQGHGCRGSTAYEPAFKLDVAFNPPLPQ